MKINTHKLLVFLFFHQEYTRRKSVTYQVLEKLFPEMSGGGLRSTLHYLKEKNLLQRAAATPVTSFELTDYGRVVLRQEFPFLFRDPLVDDADSPSSWQVLLFLDAPSHDPHFRQLQRQLGIYQPIALKKGAFLLKGLLGRELQQKIEKEYFSNVLCVEVGKWQLQNQAVLISDKSLQQNVHFALSGVSKRIDELIEKKEHKRLSTDQQKTAFISVFDDLFIQMNDAKDLFRSDFSTGETLLSLLKRLFSLF